MGTMPKDEETKIAKGEMKMDQQCGLLTILSQVLWIKPQVVFPRFPN